MCGVGGSVCVCVCLCGAMSLKSTIHNSELIEDFYQLVYVVCVSYIAYLVLIGTLLHLWPSRSSVSHPAPCPSTFECPPQICRAWQRLEQYSSHSLLLQGGYNVQ